MALRLRAGHRRRETRKTDKQWQNNRAIAFHLVDRFPVSILR
jgi:hypothetical protein